MNTQLKFLAQTSLSSAAAILHFAGNRTLDKTNDDYADKHKSDVSVFQKPSLAISVPANVACVAEAQAPAEAATVGICGNNVWAANAPLAEVAVVAASVGICGKSAHAANAYEVVSDTATFDETTAIYAINASEAVADTISAINGNSTDLYMADAPAVHHLPLSPLRKSLRQLAAKAIKRISEKPIGSDPLLGKWFAGASIAAKLQKAHGKDLPQALGLILEARGLKIWYEPVVGLSATAVFLAADNTIEALAKITVPPCGSDRKDYRPDLIVHCPRTGWTIAIEGKRGGGQSDSTAKNESTTNVRATYLSLPQWAREKGLQASICDARIIDFYGASTFADELALRGWQLDHFFGCDVEEDLAYHAACMKIGAQALLSELNGETANNHTLNSEMPNERTLNGETFEGQSFGNQTLNPAQQNPEPLIAELRFKAPAGLKPHTRNATRGTHAPIAEIDEVGTGSNVTAPRDVNNLGQANHANEADHEVHIARYWNSRRAALIRLAAAGRA